MVLHVQLLVAYTGSLGMCARVISLQHMHIDTCVCILLKIQDPDTRGFAHDNLAHGW